MQSSLRSDENSEEASSIQSCFRMAVPAALVLFATGGPIKRRLSRRLAARRIAVRASGFDSPGGWTSIEDIRKMAEPDRSPALTTKNTSIPGLNKTAKDVLPHAVLQSKYGDTMVRVLDAMTRAIHILNLSTLVLEECKDRSTVGLYGVELEKRYVRKSEDGKVTTLPSSAVTAFFMKVLQEEFPDDPVLSDVDGKVMDDDKIYAGTVALFLSHYGLIDGTNAEEISDLTRRAASYPLDATTPPKRYWVFQPIDTVEEFRGAKHYNCSLALMEDNEPVLSIMGCPVDAFDHASRSQPHPLGCCIFWAVKGLGSWTQLVVLEREIGIYQGKYGLKGKSMQLKANEKIKRGNDGLYDMLGSDQLRIAQGSRMRQDIFVDCERTGKILGSEYPKFHLCDSAIKYCWLARGDEDICWFLRQGLYDRSSTEKLIDHAAGVLIATESGAAVADFDGNPPDWSTGPQLSNNRGMAATDPSKVPILGLIRAFKQSSETSEKEYEIRCEKRREKAKILAWIFQELPNHAETEEEKRGAETVRMRGMQMLDDMKEMDKITQNSINREQPILGWADSQESAFGNDDGTLPFSPIST